MSSQPGSNTPSTHDEAVTPREPGEGGVFAGVSSTEVTQTQPGASGAARAEVARFSKDAGQAQADGLQGLGAGAVPSGVSTPGHVPASLGAAQADASVDTTALPPVPAAVPSSAASANAEAGLLSNSGVAMQEMIESIRATIEIAARQGVAHARIELQPEGLGNLSIRLSQTDEGLRARVTADTPAAAQALTQGRSELRQSLGSLGLSLLGLDIGSSANSQARERGDRFAGHPNGAGNSAESAAAGECHAVEAIGELDGPTEPTGLARGELVDVLA